MRIFIKLIGAITFLLKNVIYAHIKLLFRRT